MTEEAPTQGADLSDPNVTEEETNTTEQTETAESTTVSVEEFNQLKASFDKLQKASTTNERKQLLSELKEFGLDEKYKKATLEKLQTVLEASKELKPKFAEGSQSNNQTINTPNYFNRLTGKLEYN